jgi:hypothetical protein
VPWTFDRWEAFCAEPAPQWESQLDSELAESWRELGMDPPPPSDRAEWRIPLAEAERCMRKARTVKALEARRRHIEAALRWLHHPHPRTSPAILREIERERTRAEKALASLK